MTDIGYPLINGERHDFTSIELKIAGQIFVGFKSINYKRTRTRTKLWGNSPDPIGKTRGTNDYTCDFELYFAEWKLLKEILKKAAKAKPGIISGTSPGSGYGDVFFQIIVTYGSSQFDTQTDTINGNTADEVEGSQSQGADPLFRKVGTNPLKIIEDGDDDLGTALQAPPTT